MKKLAIIIFIMLSLNMFSFVAQGVSFTDSPPICGWISSTAPETFANNGGLTKWGSGGTDIARTIINVTTNEYYPPDTIIHNATLRIYADIVAGHVWPWYANASRITENWDTSTISWNNKPAFGTLIMQHEVPNSINGVYHYYNITNEFQSYVNNSVTCRGFYIKTYECGPSNYDYINYDGLAEARPPVFYVNSTFYTFTNCSVDDIEETSTTLNGILYYGDNATCGFWLGNQTTNSTTFEQNITPTGTYDTRDDFVESLTGLTSAKYYYVRTWHNDTDGFVNSSYESYFLTKPNEPENLTIANMTYQNATLTWTSASNDSNVNRSTIIVYKTGGYPTGLGDGTIGYNGSNSTCLIEGLQGDTKYYFIAWTYINGSGSPFLAKLSDGFDSASNTTQGGLYNITVRYENETVGNNFLVNLSQWGPHVLKIHYTDETDYVTFNNGVHSSDVDGWFDNNASGNFTIETDKTVRFFEFNWNDTYGMDYRCNRIIVPTSGQRNVTFYIRTNLPVYGETSAFPNNSLVKYVYSFLDENGVFRYPNNPKINIYMYNSTGTYMVIHSEYFDSAEQVYPWLVYGKKYYVGVSCDILDITRIGVAPTGESTTADIRIPYVENITYNFLDLIELDIGRYDGGFYIDYFDTTYSTTTVFFNVSYYENGTFIRSENSSLDAINFTYTAAEGYNSTISYTWQLTTILEGVGVENEYAGIYTIQAPMFPNVTSIINVATLDNLIEIMFGPSPIYNYDNPTGTPVRWTFIALFVFSFIILLTFGKLNAFLGMMATGMSLGIGAALIGGLGWVFGIAVLLMAIAIIGLIGGSERT